MDAPVGHDFYRMIGQQHINQHAVVVLGVPHPQLREHLDGPLARRLPFE
jgi:hypothetical protein